MTVTNYFKLVFISVILGSIAFILLSIFGLKNYKPSKKIAVFFTCAYIFFIFLITQQILSFNQLSFALKNGSTFFEFLKNNINLTPFISIIQMYKNSLSINNFDEFIRIVGGNFVMLMPLSILTPILNNKVKLLKMFLILLSTSVSIEILQLIGRLIGGIRTVEIDDVILNVCGGLTAYLIFRIIKRR